MTLKEIPYTQWNPLSVAEVMRLFNDAPFVWGLAGGYAIEQFAGQSIRDHGDIDIVVFRDTQLLLQTWLSEWQLYAADPPGNLREWRTGEYLPFGINDIWAHRKNLQYWEIQFMLMEVTGDTWHSKRSDLVRGHRDGLIELYGGVPCVRVEVLLLFKAKNPRPKDTIDFQTCLPKMTANSRQWLFDNLQVVYPEGHPWQDLIV